MKKNLVAIMAFIVGLAAFPGSVNAAVINANKAGRVPEKEWTFLVYLNGHNSLDSFGLMNMKQMEQVGSTDKVNVVVQWASNQNKNTERILVQKSTNPNQVTSPIVEALPPVDMGDAKELDKFLEWGARNYPAKHYFVNVWNHGNGWHIVNGAVKAIKGMRPTDISYDDNTGHHITTEELGQSMKTFARVIGHKVDVYGSDACLMAMAEVAGEMMDSVDYFVGSEEVEPGEGWPYTTFLTKWNALTSLAPREVAKLLSKDYLAAYSGGVYGRKAVTMSAMDLNEMPNFNKAMQSLSSELMRMNAGDVKKTLSTADATQSFTLGDYKDLGDFLGRMGKQTTVSSQQAALSGVKAAMSKLVISNDASSSFHAGGIAFWLPTSSYEMGSYGDRYRGLVFAKATGWGEFLKVMVGSSRK